MNDSLYQMLALWLVEIRHNLDCHEPGIKEFQQVQCTCQMPHFALKQTKIH